MTAKNRIIVSIMAIITSLVVAGSMVFIIFAATRGQITGGVNVQYDYTNQMYGTVKTRYTKTPLSTSFGNGGGDEIILTEDNKEYVEFKGYQDQTGVVKGLKPITVNNLTPENPWIIFEMEINLDLGFFHALYHIDYKLTDETTMDNVEVLMYGVLWNQEWHLTRPTQISQNFFDQEGTSWGDFMGVLSPSDITKNRRGRISLSYGNFPHYVYYMIKISDPSQEAFFNGAIQFAFWSD